MEQNKTSVINIELKSYVKPDIQEMVGRKWVTYGKDNQGFQDIIDRRIGSPTNESVINVYCNLIFGKGIAVKGQDEVYEDLVDVFPKREQRKVLEDFKTFGWFAIELLRGRGTDANRGVAKMMHIPVNKLAKEKANEQGEIDRVYYCYDWTNTRKNKPTPIPIFKGRMSESKMVLVGQPYQAGNFYYADPDYLAAMPYAQLEEEIANFSINHVKNGFSFGAIMNFNNASLLKEEQKDKIERNVKARMTGTENAGRIFLSFNEGKDQETTVSNVDVNDAHSQFEYLSQECISKILTGHGVTSPLLFGMPSAGGFGSNADELDTASKLLQDYQISPKQEFFIDTIKPVLELSSLETDLEFIPLRDSYKSTEDNETQVTDETVDDLEENVELSQVINEGAEVLIDLADNDMDGWECIDERDVDYDLEDELDNEILKLNNHKPSVLDKLIQFVSTGVARPNAKSEQDKNIDGVKYKVRYEYYPKRVSSNSRDFCRKMVAADKLYRKEDIIAMEDRVVNAGWGANGADKYSIWLYKGGGGCHHRWRRKTFKFTGRGKGDTKSPLAPTISTNKAEKEGYRVRNPKEVAMRPKDMKNEGFLKPR